MYQEEREDPLKKRRRTVLLVIIIILCFVIFCVGGWLIMGSIEGRGGGGMSRIDNRRGYKSLILLLVFVFIFILVRNKISS